MFWPSQGTELEELETKHFVLVHGGGFGAWCWYKTSTLLKENGYQVDAIDLTGSGAHSFDSNNITSLSEYVKPLTNYLEKLPESKKVRTLAPCLHSIKEFAGAFSNLKAEGMQIGCFLIQVILVGHDIGGVCVSYAMELHRSKISKAVFIAAAMLMNEQSILDMFSMQVGYEGLNFAT